MKPHITRVTLGVDDLERSLRFYRNGLGDTVNVASRIQSLNRTFGTQILLSSTARALLTREHALTALPATHVKGRASEVEVCALGNAAKALNA